MKRIISVLICVSLIFSVVGLSSCSINLGDDKNKTTDLVLNSVDNSLKNYALTKTYLDITKSIVTYNMEYGNSTFSYDKEISGNLVYKIYDFDLDGQNELLIVYSNNKYTGSEDRYIIGMEMYEYLNGEVSMADQVYQIYCSSIGDGNDVSIGTMNEPIENLNIFFKRIESYLLLCFDQKDLDVFYNKGCWKFASYYYAGGVFKEYASGYYVIDEFLDAVTEENSYVYALDRCGISVDPVVSWGFTNRTAYSISNTKSAFFSIIPKKTKLEIIKSITQENIEQSNFSCSLETEIRK